MNENPVNTPPQQPQEQEQEQKPQEGQIQFGPIIGIIVIIALLILGGLYFYGAELAREDGTSGTTSQDSESLNALEAEVQSESFADIEQDLSALEEELE